MEITILRLKWKLQQHATTLVQQYKYRGMHGGWVNGWVGERVGGQ